MSYRVLLSLDVSKVFVILNLKKFSHAGILLSMLIACSNIWNFEHPYNDQCYSIKFLFVHQDSLMEMDCFY